MPRVYCSDAALVRYILILQVTILSRLIPGIEERDKMRTQDVVNLCERILPRECMSLVFLATLEIHPSVTNLHNDVRNTYSDCLRVLGELRAPSYTST